MRQEKNVRGSGRFAHLDLLRLIACFLVVFNHTDGCIQLYEYNAGSLTVVAFLRLFIAMIVKINVPVFYMITGSLLLNSDRGYKDIFGRFFKILAILLIFSIVAHFCYTGEFYFPGFCRNFASASVDGAGPYWYLYAYLGILLILPFLRAITVRMKKQDVLYLLDPVIGPFCKELFDFKGDYKTFWSSIIYCIFSMSVGGLLTLLFKSLQRNYIQKMLK